MPDARPCRACSNLETSVSEIAVSGKDYRHVADLKARVAEAAGAERQVLAWNELDSYLGTMLGVMDGFVLVWVIVIFLALSFGLVNTLMMAVFERIREIGLMQALGMKPASILYQVLLESLMLLALGLLLGNLLAVLSDHALAGRLGPGRRGRGHGNVRRLGRALPGPKLNDMVLANAVVIVLGILTSLLPAWRASRYRPVEAIANPETINREIRNG